MLKKLFALRHTLVLLLIALLPFHALLVTVGTKLIVGPGNPPLPYLAIWKEILIAAIFVVGIMELSKKFTHRRGFQYTSILKVNAETWIILLLLLLSVLIGATHYSLLTTHYAYGFKYLFLPLLVFLLCKALPWDKDFLSEKIPGVLLLIGVFVSTYGILTFFLPQGFFTALGYSDAHSLYSPETSLSAFQQIAGTGIRRIQSTFAGPNQLGLWLLLPWSIGLIGVLKCVMPSSADRRLSIRASVRPAKRAYSALLEVTQGCAYRGIFIFCIGLALFLTFSRSAWIAAVIIFVVSVSLSLRGSVRMNVLGGLFFTVIFGMIALLFTAPQLFYRGLGNEQHLSRAREGILVMLREPLGLGLGSAGPASNRVSDACVYFPDGADTTWARGRDDLCIFVGGEQVRPSLPRGELRPAGQPLISERELRPASQPFVSEKVCECAFLPENWYLQVGVELGVLGFVLFITLILSVLRSLLLTPYSLPIFLTFLGISIAALFLHAWEDSAVAYTVWGLVGIVFSRYKSML